MIRLLVCCSLLVLAAARPAHAEWQVTPFVGLTMFGSTNVYDPEEATGNRHLHGGGSVAWLSRGLFGIEGIVTWTPGFFESSPSFEDIPSQPSVNDSRTTSIMANVLLTLPQRWTEYGLRPFVSGGFGFLRASHSDALLPVRLNTAGFNVGGGAIGFLSDRTGVRFDVRYHTTLSQAGDATSFGPAHLRYVTASVGIVFRPTPPGRR
jgi:hypothetical protein